MKIAKFIFFVIGIICMMFGISLSSYYDDYFGITYVIIGSSLLLSGAISFAATFLLDALGTINKNIVSISNKLEK